MPITKPQLSTDTKWVPLPMQAQALACGAYELFLGGAAGPGKSECLVVAPLRWVHLPTSKAILFRNSYPELKRTLIEKSRKFYPRLGATYNEGSHTWTFPSGGTIEFAYLEADRDCHRYQGADYSFCVALSTPILMGDGEWKPIKDVMVGDMVSTLEGPRRVTKTHRPGVKPLVRVEGPYGGATVSASHRLLTEHGWASPEALRSMQSHESGNRPGLSPLTYQGFSRPPEFQPLGQMPVPAHGPQPLVESPPPGFSVSTGVGQNVSSVSGGGHQGPGLPDSWCARLVLLAPDLWSAGQVGNLGIRRHGSDRDHSCCEPQGCKGGCPSCPCSDGGQPRPSSATDQGHTPSPACAGKPCVRSGGGGRARTPERIPAGSRTWTHPYTTRDFQVSSDVSLAWVCMTPAGEGEVADLTVEGASHYVAYGGIIPSNCGFDELPHFSEYVYRYMSSRLRSSSGVPIRLRSTGNPDGPHLEWVRKRFAPWIDKTTPAGKSLWFDPEGNQVAKGTPDALSRCYIPGKLSDNPYLPDSYRAQLMALDPVTRAKLLDGDWDAVIGDGSLFHQGWWQHLSSPPVCARKVRAWDLGATPTGDPTEGVLMGDRGHGVTPRWVILDVVTVKDGPTGVHRAVKKTAEMDGRGTIVCLPQDPGQAGKDQAESFVKELAGWDVRIRRPSTAKVVRAGPLSSQVGAGNVALVNGLWVPSFVAQAHAFPLAKHDDKIDAASDAFGVLTEPSRAVTTSTYDF